MTTTRRNLLAATGMAAGAAIIRTAAAVAAGAERDPLVALGAQWREAARDHARAHAAFEAAGEACYDDPDLGERADACRARRRALEAQILALPASSSAGVAVKLAVASGLADELRAMRVRAPALAPDERFMLSALEDLEGMARQMPS